MIPPNSTLVAAVGAPILGVVLAMGSHADIALDRVAGAEVAAAVAQARADAAQASRSSARAAAAATARREAQAQRAAARKAAAKKAAAQQAAAKTAKVAAKRAKAKATSSARRALTGSCVAKSSGNAGLQSWPQAVRGRITQQFGISSIGGYRPGSGSSDHHDGLALDVMTTGAKGDRIAEWAKKNADALNVSYIIWQQRIWTNGGSGWRSMSDRGGATANHMDHVHISFDPGSGRCPAG